MKRTVYTALVWCAACLLAIGCARLTGKTAGENIDDATITTEVNTAIVQEPDASYWKIDVNTTGGRVTLNGYVDSKSAEDRLIARIKQIRGVKSVKSLLRIEQRR